MAILADQSLSTQVTRTILKAHELTCSSVRKEDI